MSAPLAMRTGVRTCKNVMRTEKAHVLPERRRGTCYPP